MQVQTSRFSALLAAVFNLKSGGATLTEATPIAQPTFDILAQPVEYQLHAGINRAQGGIASFAPGVGDLGLMFVFNPVASGTLIVVEDARISPNAVTPLQRCIVTSLPATATNANTEGPLFIDTRRTTYGASGSLPVGKMYRAAAAGFGVETDALGTVWAASGVETRPDRDIILAPGTGFGLISLALLGGVTFNGSFRWRERALESNESRP